MDRYHHNALLGHVTVVRLQFSHYWILLLHQDLWVQLSYEGEENNTLDWALSQIAAASVAELSRAPGNSWEQLLLGGRSCGRWEGGLGGHNSQLFLHLNNTINCQAFQRAHIEQNT